MTLLDPQIETPLRTNPSQFQTLTVVAIILVAISGLWGFVDARALTDGVPVWMKPLKFSLSFVVLFITIALVESRFSAPVRNGWTLRIVGWVMAAAFLSEMAYMMYQGARVEASHFNLSTPFNTFMYTVVMAAGAVALVASVGVIGWLAWRDKGADLGPALREAVWLGFLVSFVLTLIVASYMSSGTGHYVGEHPLGAASLPLVGWSGVTGDLRPAHFLSLHAMQVLPLLGIWLDTQGAAGGTRTVRFAALGYIVLTLAVFGQAIMGMPLIPLG